MYSLQLTRFNCYIQLLIRLCQTYSLQLTSTNCYIQLLIWLQFTQYFIHSKHTDNVLKEIIKYNSFYRKGFGFVGLWCLAPLSFNNISVISWRSAVLVEETGEKHRPTASHWQTLSHIIYHMMLYQVHIAWAGFERTVLVVIGTDSIGSHKSNYQTITTTTSQDININTNNNISNRGITFCITDP